MTVPRVSIVVPVLNPGPSVIAALDSLRDQRYPDLEVIVQDGGSTDGSLDAVRGRDDVKLIVERDDGQTDALNKGFGRASGDVIGWLNGDDVLLEGAVRRLVRRLTEQRAAWACGPVQVVDAIRGGGYTYYPPKRLHGWHFQFGNPIAQPGSLYRREAVTALGPLDANLQYAMDFDLFRQLYSRHGAPAVVSGAVSRFTIHAQSKSGSAPRSAFFGEMAQVLARRCSSEEAASLVARQVVHKVVRESVTADGGTVDVDALVEWAEKARQDWWPSADILRPRLEFELEMELLRSPDPGSSRTGHAMRVLQQAATHSFARRRLVDGLRSIRRSARYQLGS